MSAWLFTIISERPCSFSQTEMVNWSDGVSGKKQRQEATSCSLPHLISFIFWTCLPFKKARLMEFGGYIIIEFKKSKVHWKHPLKDDWPTGFLQAIILACYVYALFIKSVLPKWSSFCQLLWAIESNFVHTLDKLFFCLFCGFVEAAA